MNIEKIRERVLENIQQQIDEGILERPLMAKACVANAIAYATGKGTKDELPLLQKMTILLHLPEFDQFQIGYYSDPDDELSVVFEIAFNKQVANLFKDVHLKIAAETIDRHLIADAEAVLEIADYRDDSTFIDRMSRNQIRAAVGHLKDRTADMVDVSTAIEAASVLRGLMSRRNDHKLHVRHGTSIERIDHITEKLRQLEVLARPDEGFGMNQHVLKMVVELNNRKPVVSQTEENNPRVTI